MKDKQSILEDQMKQLRSLREETGLSRTKFADLFGIPLRTVEDWEAGKRKMPEYLLRLMTYKIKLENMHEDSMVDLNRERPQKVSIIHDADDKLYLYDFLRTKKETSSPLE